MIQEFQNFGGKHHHARFFMGRRHVIFRGRMFHSVRVWQWTESVTCHREVFYRDYKVY